MLPSDGRWYLVMTDEFMQYALTLRTQKLLETEEIYQAGLAAYIPLVQGHFRGICENIVRLQKDRTLGEIAYLEYTLLLTELVRKKDTAQVRVYDDRWYFDSRQYTAGTFDLSFMFLKYRELWSQLISSRKRFPKISAQEITAFLLSCAPDFYKYVAAVCRFSIPDCTDSEPFLSVQRRHPFTVSAGEYMARTQTVYKESRKWTSGAALDWLSERLEYDYDFENLSGLDLSCADLSQIRLRYANLSSSVLVNTDFQDSLLTGTQFCHASMQNACLRGCLLPEADFTGACLRGASFESAIAFSGIPANQKWTDAGFRSVSFRNADLTQADFRRAKIRDADFTGAVMDGAIFHTQQLEQFLLSPAQRQAVRIADP